MKTLFSKAWMWLPRVIAGRVVAAAEEHLSPPADLGLHWARSHYQLWGWLMWFDWIWRCGEVETGEPEVPPAGMDLRPFSYSADLIARWGLDGSAGSLPVWFGDLVIKRKSKGVDADKEIRSLESETPPLDRNSGKWINNKLAAELEGVETRTLADYRLHGIKNVAKMLGRDKDGRVWRREGTANSHPWYLRSTLRAK